MESILITGASGFIGSFIVEEALKRKFGVWAGIRSSSSREYLRNRKIHIILNLKDNIYTILLHEKRHLTLVVEVCFGTFGNK